MPTTPIANNLLSIPSKKTYLIDIEGAARRYIYDHGGSHPDEFKADIQQWQKLRKDVGVGGEPVHENRLKSALLSVGILTFYLAMQLKTSPTKLPCTTCIDIDETSNRCEPLRFFLVFWSDL